MSGDVFDPTPEQDAIIRHGGDAFIRACPGAGKTRTMVERARRLLEDDGDRRGVAFLSFTNAAVEELEARLQSLGVLRTPAFPSFIGTFDRFLWHFFIAPFGLRGSKVVPRIVPDKGKWEVKAPGKDFALRLEHFDRETGTMLRAEAMRAGFAANWNPKAWEAAARWIRTRSVEDGRLDFDDIRSCVYDWLADRPFADRLGAALAGRFREIVVDEAQDCNPADLEIVGWLRSCGVTVKVVCDPHQAIYAFRGGLTDELLKFAEQFDEADRLQMSGNFRSSPAICSAVSLLRHRAHGSSADVPLGRHKDEPTPVYILSYRGHGVPASIGERFRDLAAGLGIDAGSAPVLASTWPSAGNAVGRAVPDPGVHKTLLLAAAVIGFHLSFDAGHRRDALARLHRAVLLVRGEIDNAGEYSRHVEESGIGDGRWRPGIIGIGRDLKPRDGEDGKGWLDRARTALDGGLHGSATINQRLKSHLKLDGFLQAAPPSTLPARTIHSVKGLEFPAVCVVLTTKHAGRILSMLTEAEAEPDADVMEQSRKIYVAASRAQRLLAIAAPRGTAPDLKRLLDGGGHNAKLVEL